MSPAVTLKAETEAKLAEAAELIGTEAAQLAEAAELRRATGGAELAEAAEVRRGQWIELTAEVLHHVRRQCRRHLPWHEAEDMAAEVLATELEAALEARPPRPGCVRAERLTATYLRLTALDWLTGREARRLEVLSKSEDGDTELGAEDGAEGSAATTAEDETEAATPLDVDHLYRRATSLARRLYLVADREVVFALAAALADVPAKELAAAWGVSEDVWKKARAAGAAEVRASYPDLTELVARLVGDDKHISRRRTPLAGTLTAEVDGGAAVVEDAEGWHCWRRTTVRRQLARTIGAALPEAKASRHRTGAQLAREADWLIATEQRPGRKATASKAADGWRIVEAPEDWRTTRPATLADHLAPLARRMVRAMAGALAPTSGPRPGDTLKASGLHRSHGYTAGVGAAAAGTGKAEDGWSRTYPEGAACHIGWRTEVASRETGHGHRHSVRRPQPHVRRRQAARRPLVASRPPLSTEVLRLERVEAGQWFTLAEVRRYMAATEHGRRRGSNWRPSTLVPVSLDVAAAGELAATTGEVWMASEAGGSWD